jgi:hypothetical protein
VLKLNLSNEPQWLDLGHGVRVHILPMTTALMATARDDPALTALPEDASDEVLGIAFAASVARVAITDWEGVGDADGNPIPVSAEAISALMDVFPIFEAFQTRYVEKGMLLDQEKNASASSPTGSTAGATDTANPAPISAKTARKS